MSIRTTTFYGPSQTIQVDRVLYYIRSCFLRSFLNVSPSVDSEGFRGRLLEREALNPATSMSILTSNSVVGVYNSRTAYMHTAKLLV